MSQNLSQIRALLAGHGLRPRKRYGQNFLHDQQQIQKIVRAAEIGPGDVVLEVGPGTGTLSQAMLAAGATLVAVEIDTALEPLLRETLDDQATLIIADVLAGKHRINPLVLEALSAALAGRSGFKLVANLPYNAASPVLVNFAMDHPAMKQAVVMIQREVADRLTAAPGGKNYGPLGILVSATCRVTQLFTLPPQCFWPAPQVESAVIRLERRPEPRVEDLPKFTAMIHELFTYRRKQLGTILGRDRTLPAGIDPTARPEALSMEQFIALSRWL